MAKLFPQNKSLRARNEAVYSAVVAAHATLGLIKDLDLLKPEAKGATKQLDVSISQLDLAMLAICGEE